MTQNHKISFLCAFVVFVLLICVRFYWLEYASLHEEFMFKHTVMLNSNDGYYYAEGARDRLAGFHQLGDLSPISSPLSILTAFIVQITTLPLDTVILFMPAFFGSLIAFPVYFIFLRLTVSLSSPSTSLHYLSHMCSFLCAFISGIVVSYYNRTMMGYYDTDMLLLIWVLGFYYFFFDIYQRQDFYHFFSNAYMILLGILACWWHNGLQNLFLVLWFLLLLWLCFGRYVSSHLFEKVLHMNAMIAILIIPQALFLQLGLAFIYLLIVSYAACKKIYISFCAVIMFIAIAVLLGCFDGAMYQVQAYLFQAIEQKSDFVFYDVMSTIKEVNSVGMRELSERISSHVILFVLSLLGFIYLCYQKPYFLFTLPFVGLGMAGYHIGLRFNIFAAPFMAVSLIFLLWCMLVHIRIVFLRYAIFIAAVMVFCYPSFKHIMDYKVPTVFHAKEAQILSDLKEFATPDDYVITWWDYGYGARYYADVKTLIDGGKHAGSVNYPVSYMLTTPNMAASALFARIATQITQDHILDDNQNVIMEWIVNDFNVPVQDWLIGLENTVWDVSLTHDVFYYIPFRIFSIFNTINQFSNLDIQTGQTLRDNFFYFSDLIHEEGDKIYIRRQMDHANNPSENEFLILDMKAGILQTSPTKGIRLKEVIVIDEEKQSDRFIQTVPQTTKTTFYEDSSLYALYFKTQKAVILADEYHFYATVLQLFINQEHENFELIASNPLARIFKVVW